MKIHFCHPLPAMHVEGRNNGTYNNEELGFPGIMTTLDPRLDKFMHGLRNIIWDDRRLVFIDGKILMCSKNWIRDHVHEMKGFMHWEYNIDSFLTFIIETQREDGQFYELIKQLDDPHWTYVNEDCRILYPDDNLALVRLELEADIEYLVVEGVLYNYRVTGDLAWVKSVLPALERGINYMTSDPKRWEPSLGLVKRPFTIDTWDFTYDPTIKTRSAHDRRISPDTPMSVMHGDNTGVYAAMQMLAFFRRKLGDELAAVAWETRAGVLKENIFRHLYNGTFFIHQLHLGHAGADDKENERLSLSNTYALNRGIFTTDQARRVVEEYQRRRKTTRAFAEWFSIDPPYPDFIGYPAGEYVNGAISPFAAGELARGAFACGYEDYAWDILSRFMRMMERDGKIYFLYSPEDGAPQDTLGPSAWGAASLLCAVDEGLAGIRDLDWGYRDLGFSPRFPVTPYTELRYVTGYEKTGTMVNVRYILTEEGLRYDVTSPATVIHAHILLPKGKRPAAVNVNDRPAAYTPVTVGDSLYVDFDLTLPAPGTAAMEVLFAEG